MKKAIIWVLAIIPIVFSGCSSGMQPAGTVSHSIIPTVTISPSSAPSLPPSPTAANASPQPSQTATDVPLSELLSSDLDPGQKISRSIVSDRGFVYYQKDQSIYRMDIYKKGIKEFVKTGLYCVDKLFLDKEGVLYYLGRKESNSDPILYKCDANEQKVVIQKISDVLRVDKDYIYYTYCFTSSFVDYTYIMMYDFVSGDRNRLEFEGNGFIARSPWMYQLKPLLVFHYPDEVDSSYLLDVKSLNISQPFQLSHPVDDIYNLYTRFIKDNFIHNEIYSIQNGKKYSIPSWIGNTDIIINGKRANIIYDCICITDIDGKNSVTNYIPGNDGSILTYRVVNGILYILVQKLMDPEADYNWPTKGPLKLFSYDSNSYEFVKLWETDSFDRNGDDISIEIEAGYVWLFSITGNEFVNYIMKIPMNQLNK